MLAFVGIPSSEQSTCNYVRRYWQANWRECDGTHRKGNSCLEVSMKKWEYMYLTFANDDVHSPYPSEGELDMQGERGWEAVCALPATERAVAVILMKRELQPKND